MGDCGSDGGNDTSGRALSLMLGMLSRRRWKRECRCAVRALRLEESCCSGQSNVGNMTEMSKLTASVSPLWR
jgi:hypothetical protein